MFTKLFKFFVIITVFFGVFSSVLAVNLTPPSSEGGSPNKTYEIEGNLNESKQIKPTFYESKNYPTTPLNTNEKKKGFFSNFSSKAKAVGVRIKNNTKDSLNGLVNYFGNENNSKKVLGASLLGVFGGAGIGYATRKLRSKLSSASANTKKVFGFLKDISTKYQGFKRTASTYIANLGSKFEGFIDKHIGRQDGKMGYVKGLAAGVAIFAVSTITSIGAVAINPTDTVNGLLNQAKDIGRYSLQTLKQPNVFISDTKANFNDFLFWVDNSSMYEKGKAVSEFSINSGLAVESTVSIANKAGVLAGGIRQSDEYVNLATRERTEHILKGEPNTRGGWDGGHRPGSNKGKTEFPEGWSDEKIMHNISDIATDPKLKWDKNKNLNNHEVIGEREGVKIKVILRKSNGEIVTAFPLK